MYKILFLILLGFCIGLIVSSYLPAKIQYKGKFRQKGQNNVMNIKKEENVKKRRLFKRKRAKN